MSEPIKLKKAGDAHTLVVAACDKLPFGKYPEYEFVGRDGSKVRVPEKSVMRQLDRLKLSLDSVVGCHLTFSRGANPSNASKPFWNVDLASGAENGTGGVANATKAAVKTKSIETEAVATTPTPPAEEKGSALYLKVTAWVLKDIAKLYKDAGIPLTDRGAAAIVATLYISAKH